MLLNYPNNPTGYTPNVEEVKTIVSAIQDLANKGTKVIAVVDDAYYGLFYEDVYTQSIFTALTQVNSKNIPACSSRWCNKRIFAWGFRVGFHDFWY